jgi:hypothetical protein
MAGQVFAGGQAFAIVGRADIMIEFSETTI